jgi:hypothetical protein
MFSNNKQSLQTQTPSLIKSSEPYATIPHPFKFNDLPTSINNKLNSNSKDKGSHINKIKCIAAIKENVNKSKEMLRV